MLKPNTLLHNISLQPYNTFGIDVDAKSFIEVTSKEKLQEILFSDPETEKFIFGGGSNMLLTKDVDALVIHLNTKGKEVVFSQGNEAHVKVEAGENWHEFVQWAIDNNLGGIENLSLIPGNVGTAPIQNIGAYGVELKDVFVSCEALDTIEKKTVRFSREDCQFEYRNSIFKRNKGRYVITSVTLKLSTHSHQINTSYGAIETELSKQNIQEPTIKQVSEAVIHIRESKLPDPKELGNSGSFFKNPIISKAALIPLQNDFPNIPHYLVSENKVKVPAGWLIEQCGFKGKRFGDAGVHEKQALVLVNYGNASGKDIWNLAMKIQKSVQNKFNISIEPEVNIY